MSHQVGKELQEEGQHEQPNVHSVDIGVSGYYDLAVPQCIQPVFNIQSMLQKVKFLVFVHDFLSQAKAV